MAGDYAVRVGANRDDVESFVSEAVTNAVVHAYGKQAKGSVALEMRATLEHELLLSVVDDGVGMRPDPGGSGLGFGLAVMAAVSRSFSVERLANGGTRISAHFPVTPA